MQLSPEQANAHFHTTIDFRLASRGGHLIPAPQTLVKSNLTDVDLFAFKRTGEYDRVGGDLSIFRTRSVPPQSWQLIGLLDFLDITLRLAVLIRPPYPTGPGCRNNSKASMPGSCGLD